VFITDSGCKPPEAAGPQGACSTNGIPKVSPAVARGVANWQKATGLKLQEIQNPSAWPPEAYLKVSRWGVASNPVALQRLREKLEMEALAAGHPRPEQAAALQLLEVAP